MTTKRISMAAAALLATTLGAGIALAQSNAPPPRAPIKQGGADQPGMMDMSKMDGMMAKMDRMMDNCNRMMESKQQHSPSEPRTTAPDKG